jgi:hypothetical protein
MKILCKLGIHRWVYFRRLDLDLPRERFCSCCRRDQTWRDEPIYDGFAGISPGGWEWEIKAPATPKPSRIIANAIVALALALLATLVLFAHLSTLVVPEPERAAISQDIPFRRTP